MTSLAETIDIALAAVGTETEEQLRDVVAAFEAMNLADEERVAALATAIAALTQRHHARHVTVYLDAVRTWSLEVAELLQPDATELRYMPDTALIEQAGRRLFSGLDSVIERMRFLDIDIRDRLVTELAVIARFLGQHDANTIVIAVMAVNRAVADPAYRRGAIVRVPLREVISNAVPGPDLGELEPRGSA